MGVRRKDAIYKGSQKYIAAKNTKDGPFQKLATFFIILDLDQIV